MAVFFIIILTNEHHVILTCVPLHAQNSSNGEISFFVTRDRIFFLVELLSKVEKNDCDGAVDDILFFHVLSCFILILLLPFRVISDSWFIRIASVIARLRFL